ncbi:hypothetical protein [Limnobacter sp.]|uniref:hypothetical protein n=1 Tax=Limnobacter sp. TaxID=2003368 RepID=UPI002FE24796
MLNANTPDKFIFMVQAANTSKFGNAEPKCGALFGEFGKATYLLDFSMPIRKETPTPEDSTSQEQAQVAIQAMAMLSSLGAIGCWLISYCFHLAPI